MNNVLGNRSAVNAKTESLLNPIQRAVGRNYKYTGWMGTVYVRKPEVSSGGKLIKWVTSR